MTEEPKVDETKDESLPGDEPLSEEPRPERRIADELDKLGKQLTDAAKAAWESEERRNLQNEIVSGIQKLGHDLTSAIEKATRSEQAQDVRTRATKVAEDIQRTDVVEEVRKGVLVGLEAINRELGKLLERLDSTPGPVEADETATVSHEGEAGSVAETSGAPEVTDAEETPAA